MGDVEAGEEDPVLDAFFGVEAAFGEGTFSNIHVKLQEVRMHACTELA